MSGEQVSPQAIDDAITRACLEAELLACQHSLEYLCREKIGYPDISEFHQEVFEFLQRPTTRRLILLPRGHLKTSIVTVANTVRTLMLDPDARILIDNATWQNSRTMLRSIKAILQSKPIQEIYPHTFVRETMDEIILSTRKNTSLKEPSVDTSGVERTKTSQHYSHILADDLISRENVTNREMMDRLKLHYRDLLDLLEPETGVLTLVGTRWNYGDLYGMILDQIDQGDESWDVLRMKAVDDGWTKVLFPEKFSVEYLRKLQTDKGSYEFSCQYLNEPVDDESAHFRRSDIRYFEELPENVTSFVAIDPAFTTREQGDYTGAVVVMTDDQRPFNVYVEAYVREHLTPSGVVDMVYELRDRYEPDMMGIESNSAQKVLYDFVLKDPRASRLPPFCELKPDSDKFRRILRLQPFFENHRVFIRRGMRELMDELFQFPKGEHDDLIDALAYAVRVMSETEPKKEKLKVGTAEWIEEREERMKQKRGEQPELLDLEEVA